jgi:hypothetical protein
LLVSGQVLLFPSLADDGKGFDDDGAGGRRFVVEFAASDKHYDGDEEHACGKKVCCPKVDVEFKERANDTTYY